MRSLFIKNKKMSFKIEKSMEELEILKNISSKVLRYNDDMILLFDNNLDVKIQSSQIAPYEKNKKVINTAHYESYITYEVLDPRKNLYKFFVSITFVHMNDKIYPFFDISEGYYEQLAFEEELGDEDSANTRIYRNINIPILDDKDLDLTIENVFNIISKVIFLVVYSNYYYCQKNKIEYVNHQSIERLILSSISVKFDKADDENIEISLENNFDKNIFFRFLYFNTKEIDTNNPQYINSVVSKTRLDMSGARR